jgi:hypothetical protein
VLTGQSLHFLIFFLSQSGILIYHIDTSVGYNIQGYPGQTGSPSWPSNGKHYRVALMQADGLYELEKGTNSANAGDVYHGLGVKRIGPGPDVYPNTDTYQGGRIARTGIEISNIGNSQPIMTFDFYVPNVRRR